VSLHDATAYELISDSQPGAPALVHGDHTRTWAELDDRAARLAAAFVAAGLGRGSRVAVDLYNSNEFIETHLAALKSRCVPVHINYRYVDTELGYLLDNCDAEAIVYHRGLGEHVGRVAAHTPTMKLMVEVDDGSGSSAGAGVADYEPLLAAHEPAARIERSVDDPTLWYTGGTTGLPKGVEGRLGAAPPWKRGASGALLGLGDDSPDDVLAVIELLRSRDAMPVGIPASPLMHSTGMMGLVTPVLGVGGTVVTLTARSFDANELVTTIERQRATIVTVVGDAIARPLVRALDDRVTAGRPADSSSLQAICSAGVQFSGDVKERLIAHVPQLTIVDSCGSSDGARYGTSVTRRGDRASTARFDAAPGLIVLDDRGRPTEPGSGTVGLLAAPTGIAGYLKDPEKSADTYRVIDGQRYAVPGDYGRIDADGSLTLVGRGSATINTGGEKVHPEEVEEVLKNVVGVEDCVVLGLPDERWVQRVVALVQSSDADTTERMLIDHAHDRLARYKAPKQVIFVERIPRFANGKPDHDAARRVAAEAVGVSLEGTSA
jgi:acyl-CoA synthetase (AMP-forming)/AMP-acid ligase II